jgi:hypothetical protein
VIHHKDAYGEGPHAGKQLFIRIGHAQCLIMSLEEGRHVQGHAMELR